MNEKVKESVLTLPNHTKPGCVGFTGVYGGVER